MYVFRKFAACFTAIIITSAILVFAAISRYKKTIECNTDAAAPVTDADGVDRNVDDITVDLVYTYVDLRDENLRRDVKIAKDYDNEELKFSLRSVAENLPWVRKIFIMMPNNEVSFLKGSFAINEKIVYVRDSDFLPFRTQSSITFEYNLWRLKDFGCSDYLIYLNDDYFIGKPLKKSDFFYKENGKVAPYIISDSGCTSRSSAEIMANLQIRKDDFKKKPKDDTAYQTSMAYQIQTFRTFEFLCKYFGHARLLVTNSCILHNAKGYTLPELKEIYDLVDKNYKYADECLTSANRTNRQLTHQVLYDTYFLNKDCRKINPDVSYEIVDLAEAANADFNYSLFCINTGGDCEYSLVEKQAAHAKMEELFPNKTPYEK
jgi:hypothetical protein